MGNSGKSAMEIYRNEGLNGKNMYIWRFSWENMGKPIYKWRFLNGHIISKSMLGF